MSMLSAQIDKLRALADRMDGIVPNTPDELRDAADTIWQLRNDLQRANAVNTRLRELVSSYDSALNRLCDQMQGHVECSKCVLGRRFDEDTCALDELRKASIERRVEVDE